ncbi:integrator complex subunit 12-like [Bacillus rossius redtenbacheri]|uniref:integrator complex subunit 12-like n=1 Tax=Bacillus rossius redtenbacheri TaxID=93214 RepID=UPI002FDD91DE
MATIELDPHFVRAIRLMNSTTVRDADEQIRTMLEEAVKQKYGTAKTIAVIEKESMGKRKEEVVVVGESGPESGRPSPEVVDLEDDEFGLGILEDDLTCVVCHGMGVTARNQLVECVECHALYHQECHSPPVTDMNDARSVWYCAGCAKAVGKPPARASPKFLERQDAAPFKPPSGRSTPNATPAALPKSPAGAGGSKLAKPAPPKVNIVSVDKRLQDMKKKAAAKLHEKRKHPK